MNTVPLGSLITPARSVRAGEGAYPVLSITMHEGLVFQQERFKKTIAGKDLSSYKVVNRGQLVVGFPIDEAVLDFQEITDAGIVSPAYGVWDVVDPEAVNSSYLGKYLRSPQAISYYKLRLRGTTARRRSLTRDTFEALPVPLPPISEQQRIAEILDSSGTVIQQIESQLLLLADLATSYAAHHSEHEEIAPLSSFGSFSGGMTPDKKNPNYWGGLIRWFTTKDLKKPVLVDSIDHATHQAIDETSLKLIDTPSIAFSLRGMSLAHTVPMSRLPAYSTVNQDLKAFVPHDPDHVRVLYTLIKAKTPWLLSKVSTAGHGTKKLDFTHLQNLELPVLSEEEFAQLDKVLSQIEDLEQKKNQELESFRELQESLSTRAFAGQL